MQVTISEDGSIRIPREALDVLGAEPGDDLKVILDRRRRAVRLERTSGDPWADAMREPKSKDFEDLLEEQKRREAEARAAFDRESS